MNKLFRMLALLAGLIASGAHGACPTFAAGDTNYITKLNQLSSGCVPTSGDTTIPRAAAGGTANAITATFSPAITLADKTIVAVVAGAANSTTTPTFAPNGLTAHTITKNGNSALAAGDIAAAGHVIVLEYNLAGTRWELLNPAPVGFANPMTTAGDLIYGGASGTPTRLAGGTSGYVLTSNGATSAPSWQAAAGGSSLTASYIGYGDGSNLLTGTSDLQYTTATGNLAITKSYAAAVKQVIQNTSNSVAAQAGMWVMNDNGDPLIVGKRSTTFSTTGLADAAAGFLSNASGVMVLENAGSTDFIFARGGLAATNEVARLGAGTLSLGVAGTTVGSLSFKNATSGAITVTPATGALGSSAWTLPAATDTFVGKDTTDTLTNKTLTSPTIAKLANLTSNGCVQTSGSDGTLSITTCGSGSGTVTHTGGALTANAVVLGAGTDDTKVVAGITTDGTSALNLGVGGSSVGKVVLANATSGTITLQPPTGALGTVTVTVPAATGTLLYSGGPGGTPSSMTGTNITGIPPAGVTGTAAILGANAFTGTQNVTNASANAATLILGGVANSNIPVGDAIHLVEVINDATTSQVFRMSTYGTSGSLGGQNNMNFFRAGGTLASPTAVVSGNTFLGMGARGWDGTVSSQTAALLTITANENWDATHHGTKFDFQVTPSGGSVTRSSAFTIDSTGGAFPGTITTGAASGTTGAILFKGTTSGTATLTVGAAAGTPTITLPASTGTLATLALSETLSNKTLSAPSVTGTLSSTGVISTSQTGTGAILASGTNNGAITIDVTNASTGTGGFANVRAINSAGNSVGFVKRGTGYTTNGLLVADGSELVSSTTQFLYRSDAGSHVFAAGGFAAANEVLRMTSTNMTMNMPLLTKGYTVATLPASPGTGARAHVTDQLTTCAAIGAALTGGGAVACPAFYNGSAWVGG